MRLKIRKILKKRMRTSFFGQRLELVSELMSLSQRLKEKLHYKGFKPKQIPFKIVKGEREWFMPNTKGIRVPARDFIAMDAAKMKKPIDKLMKQIGKALKK